MSDEINNIAILSTPEIGEEFSGHLEKISQSIKVTSYRSLEELKSEAKSINVLYWESNQYSESSSQIIEYCNIKNIMPVEIIANRNPENDYEIDASKISYPLTTKDLSVSLYCCELVIKSNNQVNNMQERNEEIMISLANSNVRVILLSEALQRLRVSESTMSLKGGFLCYMCDFLNNIKTIADTKDAYFVIFDKSGKISKLYNWEDQIEDISFSGELQYLCDEIYGVCANYTEVSTENESKFSFEYEEHEEKLLMYGRPIFVNKKLYGAIIIVKKSCGNEVDSVSNDNTISVLSSELEKSLERYVLGRKLATKNKALFKMNTRMDFLLKSSPAVLFNLSKEEIFKFDFVSKNIKKLTGYSARELMADPEVYLSLIHKDDISSFYRLLDDLKQNNSCVREYRITTKSGRNIWVYDEIITHKNSQGEITDIVGYLVDIDAKVKSKLELQQKNKELEAAYQNLEQTKDQLLQSDKLASIGQLAAGVAHEINNPVGYISSNLSSLKNYIDDLISIIDTIQLPISNKNYASVTESLEKIKSETEYDYIKQDLPELLEQSLDGVKRVKQIVQDLKDFSHADEEEWHLSDLHKGIDSTLNIVNNEVKYKADIVKDYSDIPNIECIPAQLNQVFMNLLVNAAHAIKERGTITIKTWADQNNVFISVSDTGQGIAQENLRKLFDPFFTTKPVGEGTGLGLALSYGIIERHSGEISVESTVGKGTTFTIRLPISHHSQNENVHQLNQAVNN